jgi:hypothetical protein
MFFAVGKILDIEFSCQFYQQMLQETLLKLVSSIILRSKSYLPAAVLDRSRSRACCRN